ncbi:NAD(P)H-dependent glycerol-3-phosphate dehydrogenase [Zoogloea sp. 1C4]|uniref:NAD(P)H-dependent glycerol-3-phosphate dehydrogenase n=1 Tax=Zoogloea sp. 1C4 TaxID=2570190 RepID=UPI001290BF64|nr:NAD(P)H-dependent glycerol-3-phosphate dehydrogenase [Zoogloea sp. 1C4]
MRIAVFGAGAWGTALALAFARGHQVVLWSRESAEIAALRADGENRRYLPGIPLPAEIELTDGLPEAAKADLHLVVTPLAGLRATARALRAAAPGTPLLWACKGLEAGTAKLPHQIVAEELGEDAPCGVLTGPSFAAEVAKGLPAAVTVAARDIDFARHWVQALHNNRLRLYANDDLVGAEVGGAVKNVMAIAAGVADGMGFGLNARAALITRGLAEITRLGVELGARRDTFMGLAGLGDLVLTCTGDLSRNRRVGLMLAEGKTLPDILAALGHVAEGVSTTHEVAALAGRLGVDMPITLAVDGVLNGTVSARDAVEQLLARDPKQE